MAETPLQEARWARANRARPAKAGSPEWSDISGLTEGSALFPSKIRRCNKHLTPHTFQSTPFIDSWKPACMR